MKQRHIKKKQIKDKIENIGLSASRGALQAVAGHGPAPAMFWLRVIAKINRAIIA